MTNMIEGNKRRNLKRLNNKRIKALKENSHLSEQEKNKLQKKIDRSNKFLMLTLDDLASHHYDY